MKAENYEICLPDYEAVLPMVAQHIGAPYSPGDFETAHAAFLESGESEATWRLAGERGSLEVRFEEYEGYFFAVLSATGAAFSESKEALWAAYIAQGGKPGAQRSP